MMLQATTQAPAFPDSVDAGMRDVGRHTISPAVLVALVVVVLALAARVRRRRRRRRA